MSGINELQKPLVGVLKDTKIMDMLQLMLDRGVGAAVVVADGQAIGIFTERDLMTKVVLARRDPDKTTVSEVMTSPVLHIDQNAEPDAALQIMLERHIRHLVVMDTAGKTTGMLSIRHLMSHKIGELTQEVGELGTYIRENI